MRAPWRQDRRFVQFQASAEMTSSLPGQARGDLVQRGQAARVALHRDHLVRAFRQQRAGQAAGARADLVEHAAVFRAGGAGDLAGEIEVEQEILAQRFLRRQAVRGDHVAQRRQIIGSSVARRSAISAAILIAAIMLRASALPVPAMSNAVP